MQPCRVCQHRQRKIINQQLLDGLPYRVIGQQFGLTKDSLWRHWRSQHVSHIAPKFIWLDFAEVCPDGELPPNGPLMVRLQTGPKTSRKVLARHSNGMLFFSPAHIPWVTISNSVYSAQLRAYYGKTLALDCPECNREARRLYFWNEAIVPRKQHWLTFCERCLSDWRAESTATDIAGIAAHQKAVVLPTQQNALAWQAEDGLVEGAEARRDVIECGAIKKGTVAGDVARLPVAETTQAQPLEPAQWGEADQWNWN